MQEENIHGEIKRSRSERVTWVWETHLRWAERAHTHTLVSLGSVCKWVIVENIIVNN